MDILIVVCLLSLVAGGIFGCVIGYFARRYIAADAYDEVFRVWEEEVKPRELSHPEDINYMRGYSRVVEIIQATDAI